MKSIMAGAWLYTPCTRLYITRRKAWWNYYFIRNFDLINSMYSIIGKVLLGLMVFDPADGIEVKRDQACDQP